ncbi:MAG: ligand-binding sensor domain-containing protein, partial [Owenweeksia sp.]
MLQDRKGFMWFGTLGGLNRYDGYQFKVFRFDPDNPYSLSGNNIFALYEDHKGRIWIGTNGQGLNVYDPQTDRVYRVSGNEISAEHLNALEIKSITQDHYGNIWIGGHSDNTPFGLFRLKFEWPSTTNPPATLMGSISEIQLEPDSLVLHNNIYTVYHFKDKLWVGTDWGLYTIDPEKISRSIV